MKHTGGGTMTQIGKCLLHKHTDYVQSQEPMKRGDHSDSHL